jgi:hypothetical protein
VIIDVCLVAACLRPEAECMEADGDANENIIKHQHVWHQHHTDGEQEIGEYGEAIGCQIHENHRVTVPAGVNLSSASSCIKGMDFAEE